MLYETITLLEIVCEIIKRITSLDLDIIKNDKNFKLINLDNYILYEFPYQRDIDVTKISEYLSPILQDCHFLDQLEELIKLINPPDDPINKELIIKTLVRREEIYQELGKSRYDIKRG